MTTTATYNAAEPYAYGTPPRGHRQCHIGWGRRVVALVADTGWFVYGRHLILAPYGDAHETLEEWWGPYDTEDAARARADAYYALVDV